MRRCMSEGVLGRGEFFLLLCGVAGAGIVTDGQNDAEIHPRNQVRRTAFGDEWERLSRDRCQSYGHSHIGQGLNEQNDADPHHDKGRWSAGTLLGDVIGADEKTHIEQEDKGTAEDAELFADDGENEVGISGRKVVALHRAPRAATDEKMTPTSLKPRPEAAAAFATAWRLLVMSSPLLMPAAESVAAAVAASPRP